MFLCRHRFSKSSNGVTNNGVSIPIEAFTLRMCASLFALAMCLQPSAAR